MTDLVAFLKARLDDDEAVARAFVTPQGLPDEWSVDDIGGKVRSIREQPWGLPDVVAEADTHMTAAHIARHDPARVLAEVAAKRAIVEQVCDIPWGGYAVRDTILRHLVQPFASHPDFDPAWRLS